ncbi:pentatricopeptide repeat-containing protein At3g60980, mitochondrial isoform X2 [Capsella rubella]|uniref:pentatricopeptide repeat-containing protein At3g60980, mitochondrial isoform X2 n=1 Tax=Capsella rubella TaxID=81985 RepID=UPI000CD4C5A6|nr:pentatricopeptide repeat-containing protein At3g60980, mitochondrial isoform X2 [Capsella rubella]
MITSLIRGLVIGRRFCTAVPRRAEDIMSNPDLRPTQLCLRVSYLIRFVGDLDTAAKYARLAAFTEIESESTIITCQHIIGAMMRDKRCIANSETVHDYPSNDTFRVLTKGLVHFGRLDKAQTFLRDRTSDKIRDYPDHVAFNYLIRGFLDLGNLDMANLVLNEFKQLCYDAMSYTKDIYLDSISDFDNRVAFLRATFMEYWFKQGKKVEAMDCYNRSVLSSMLVPCAETGNALLVVLLKYGEKKLAWELYNEMLKKSEPDSDTIKIMVDECFDMGRFKEAVDTYVDASDAYIYIKCCQGADSFSFPVFSGGYVIARCCESGIAEMWDTAECLFVENIVRDDFGYVEVSHLKTLIDTYVKAGRIDDALNVSNTLFDLVVKEVFNLF